METSQATWFVFMSCDQNKNIPNNMSRIWPAIFYGSELLVTF